MIPHIALIGSLFTSLLLGPGSTLQSDWAMEPILTRQESPRPVPNNFAQRNDVQQFIDEMVGRHGFSRTQLQQWFGQIHSQEDILRLISRPAEKTLTWGEYREIFLDQRRIDNGAAFWERHWSTLERAQRDYGVPPQVVVAILGVETRYGKVTGSHGVLEALSTLAFDYPPRADFFRRELEAFLQLVHEEDINPLSLQGSYAGAMGLAQFMPSSYRAYAVDFDGDNHRDLWHNPVDAIGSIANYLAEHRWQRDGLITLPASVAGNGYQRFISRGLEAPEAEMAQLQSAGVSPRRPVAPQTRAFLLALTTSGGVEHWLGFYNFYAITRYNRSPLYAMAVHQLGEAIQHHVD